MLTLIIDGDTLVYDACKANEYECAWDPELWTLHGNLTDAKVHFDNLVHGLQEKLDATAVVIALSDYTDPWRKKILPSYKSERNNARKPVTYKPLREYVHENYKTYQKPGLEGDDVCGILLTHPNIIKGDRVLASIDKDMKTLPGSHYNPRTGQRLEVCEDEADYFHLYQTLTGDRVDGYAGCPGIGPVNAEKILKDLSLWGETNAWFNVPLAWKAVVAAYESKGLTEADALATARVARIARHTDYDFVNKTIKLWTPA